VPDVELNQSLTLRIQRGTLMLSLPVRARETAAIGDIIRVYSPELKTMYKARIADAQTAVWVATP
jgi:flagella basal body P-ring formation protein FlgA